MYESRYFQALPFIPFCVEKNPQTLYVKYGGCLVGSGEELIPFNITNSGIDTTKKSMQFYWLLRTLTVTVTFVNSAGFYEQPLIATQTTTLDYRRFNKDSEQVTLEPYERVCESELGYNTGEGTIAGAFPRPFEMGDEIALHYDSIPIIQPDYGDSGFTEEDAYPLALTTHNEDYSYVCNEPYGFVDQTIPITFGSEDTIGPFTLYVKRVVDQNTASTVQLTDAVVDDFTYYTIKER